MKPKIGSEVFIAPSADIIGDVTIGNHSSVWFNCTLRADVHSIQIGDNSNIQDNSVIHVTGKKYKTVIGNNVTIGHHAVVHGAELRDFAFVGLSATVLDQVIINSYGFVAAGALVPPRFEVPERTLVAGVPAKVIRELRQDEIEMIKSTAVGYQKNAQRFLKELYI